MESIIRFPALGIELDPPRVAFNILGHSIYFYGIIMALAFLLAAIYCFRRANALGVNRDILLDAVILAVPAATIFARLYYVVFSWEDYASDPIRILYIWEGGVAIYGALIGAFLAVWIMCRVRKIKAGAYLDLAALGFLLGQSIGRWGNFINREAHGTETTLPWGMEIYDYIAGARITVHPTFLYESLWNILGFVILHFRSKKRAFKGEVFLWYLVWYGLGRAVIEGLRTDSLYLFGTGIRVSQLLAILCVIAGGVLLFYNFAIKPKDIRLRDEEEAAEPGKSPENPEAESEDPAVSEDGGEPDNPENGPPDPDGIKDDLYDGDQAPDEDETPPADEEGPDGRK